MLPGAIAVALHVVATLWVLVWYERGALDLLARRSLGSWYEGTWEHLLLLCVSALPLAQATLLALWAVSGRLIACLRVPMAILLLTVIWLVECKALAFEMADYRTAAHALMLLCQFLWVVGMTGCVLAIRRLCRHRPGSPSERSRFQFRLVSVLVWMLGMGVLLGVGRLILMYAQWTPEILQGELFFYGVIVGCFNAAFGLLLILAMSWGRRRWPAACAALALIFALAWLQPSVMQAMFGAAGRMSRVDWLLQAGFQSTFLLATLALIRCKPYNAKRDEQRSCMPAQGDLP
jgi:hypothetical protein